MSSYRVAHLSDPHLLDLTGVPTAQLLLNKRFTGWVNLKLNRGSHHKPWIVEAMMDDLRAHPVDHVVVTGDLTNLALDPEFVRARETLERMGYGPDAVSVIPGNHDLYTHGSQREQRFAKHFAKYITSDLDLGELSHPSGPFPFVRLRGPAAIIGLSTAVARPPAVSSGWAGEAQLDALRRVLEHPEVRARTPIVMAHHPITNPESSLKTLLRGWSEVAALRAAFEGVRESLSLHGHLHHRVHEVIATAAGGRIHRLGATSASLLDEGAQKMAGYNVYELREGASLEVSARVWSEASRAFEPAGESAFARA